MAKKETSTVLTYEQGRNRSQEELDQQLLNDDILDVKSEFVKGLSSLGDKIRDEEKILREANKALENARYGRPGNVVNTLLNAKKLIDDSENSIKFLRSREEFLKQELAVLFPV